LILKFFIFKFGYLDFKKAYLKMESSTTKEEKLQRVEEIMNDVNLMRIFQYLSKAKCVAYYTLAIILSST
jgi:hypothetical protein